MVEQRINSEVYNIHMYSYLLFAAIHHQNRPRADFLCPTSWLSRQSNGRSNAEVVGSIPTEVKRIFSLPRVVP